MPLSMRLVPLLEGVLRPVVASTSEAITSWKPWTMSCSLHQWPSSAGGLENPLSHNAQNTLLAGFISSLVAMGQTKVEPPPRLESPLVPHNNLSSITQTGRQILRGPQSRRLKGANGYAVWVLPMNGSRRSSYNLLRCSARIHHASAQGFTRVTAMRLSCKSTLAIQLSSKARTSIRRSIELILGIFLATCAQSGKSFHQPPAWLIEGPAEDVMAMGGASPRVCASS